MHQRILHYAPENPTLCTTLESSSSLFVMDSDANILQEDIIIDESSQLDNFVAQFESTPSNQDLDEDDELTPLASPHAPSDNNILPSFMNQIVDLMDASPLIYFVCQLLAVKYLLSDIRGRILDEKCVRISHAHLDTKIVES